MFAYHGNNQKSKNYKGGSGPHKGPPGNQPSQVQDPHQKA